MPEPTHAPPGAGIRPLSASGAAGQRVALLLVLVGALAAGCSRGDAKGKEDPEAPAEREEIAVRADPVRVEQISSLYSTSTTLRSARRATVPSRTRGVIERLLVEAGDTVRADQALAHLEDDEQQISAARTRATAGLRAAEAERAASLHEQGLLSDDAHDAVQREAAEARHAAQLADLNLTRTIIRAPFAGRILTRHLDVGASVSDGTAIYDVADTTQLEADVSVPERHVARLRIGQEVRLVLDATRAPLPASVARLAPSVDAATGTVKVTLAIQGSEDLRPGAFVRADIVTEVHPEALVVPRSALIAEGQQWHLFRVREDGLSVEQLTATLGFEEGDRVEIVQTTGGESALAAGQRIVIAGASALSEGSLVKVVELEQDSQPEAAADGAGGRS